jgi:small-conductance mechanosensitive channel
MSIESIRELGVSLLASAGVAGIIIGFAAQRSFGQVFSGIQIAFTQPIRIDDVVVIEGEWGRIEEINITYAVVKIWDQRRLIVPIDYFLNNPIQNWTRTESDVSAPIARIKS